MEKQTNKKEQILMLRVSELFWIKSLFVAVGVDEFIRPFCTKKLI
jgi:hypothetical protein